MIFTRSRRYLTTSSIIPKLPITILQSISRSEKYPISWLQLQSQIQRMEQGDNTFSSSKSRLIVLDDDPTGCQTMYNINVLLSYDIPTLIKQLQLDHPVFYILTNTRAMDEISAVNVTKNVIKNLYEAKKRLNYSSSFEFISRGDSTLRGHYPAEVDAIAEAAGYNQYATVLLPAFHEGGRITMNSIHYLTENQELVPVGMTPFALDPHFGYRYVPQY